MAENVALANYNLVVIPISLSLLLFFVPIWWVLWKAGWRRYMKISNPWLSVASETITALLLSLGMNLVFPQVFRWVFQMAREITGNYQYGITIAANFSWYVYLYPLALLVFLVLLWKNRNRDCI